MVLGALPEAVSQEATLDVNLWQGDRVVLYSDRFTVKAPPIGYVS